jgi:hypothetical protein
MMAIHDVSGHIPCHQKHTEAQAAPKKAPKTDATQIFRVKKNVHHAIIPRKYTRRTDKQKYPQTQQNRIVAQVHKEQLYRKTIPNAFYEIY